MTGRILAYGVTFRSKLFLKGDTELQREILTEMLTKSKERIYLPLLTYSFVVDFMKNNVRLIFFLLRYEKASSAMCVTFQVDENTFKKAVWPILKDYVLVDWSHQSFETLYCLIEIYNVYPNILKKKLMLPIFGTSFILEIDTIETVQKMLTVLFISLY